MQQKIIIYCSHFNTNRLQYVLDFIFNQQLGITYSITNNEEEFNTSIYFKVNYSHKNVQSDVQINAIGLLFETEIVEKNIVVTHWKQLPIFFQGYDEQEIPFDIFSAIFYLLSRYEEYLPYEPDMYLRFPHTQSLAFQNDFLNIPLVDLWLEEFKKVLLQKANFSFKKNTFQFLPTYDIDIAYSYKGKGILRTIGAVIKNLSSIKSRLAVAYNKQKDPYDCYDFLDEMHAIYSLQPIYFFLLSSGGKYDKNLARTSSVMTTLIANIHSKYNIGIHPSWNSHESFETLQEEVFLLNKVTKSRQHYIRFTLPDTFRNLLKLGITDDYSMGYGSINGFRASTSHSFKWFDIEKNEVSHLTLHPFCYMECNSFFEQKNTKEQAYDEMLHYLNVVKAVNGNYITVWHNFSLGTDALWRGWKEVYEKFLKEVSN